MSNSAAHKIPFNALPAPTRRRFVAATQGQGNAPVLAQQTGKIGPYIGWGFIILCTLVMCFVLLDDGFGSPWRHRMEVEAYLGLAAGLWVMGYAILAIVRRIMRDSRTPYRRGRYLFATDVVRAETDTLEIYPLNQIAKVDVIHQHQNGRYVRTDIHFRFNGGPTETFQVFTRMEADRVLNTLQQTQRAIGEAAQAADLQLVSQLDLFFEARASSVWRDPAAAAQVAAHPDGDTNTKPVPGFLKWASASALGFAVLAAPVGYARDFMSDESAFSSAVRRQSVRDLENYIRNGGRYSDEATQVHLPAAAFAEAQQTGTVTALRDFILAHPTAQQVPMARQVVHQRFAQVHQQFLAQANMSKPAMPQFMEALLAWLEAHDSPPVQVRFAPPSSETLAAVDASLRERSSDISPISPHFTAERMESRENGITEVLRRGFGAVFPEDVMSLNHAGRTANVAANVPTFDVRYQVLASGATYTSQETGREFVGIAVNFDVQMRIPDSPITYEFVVNVEPPEHFRVNYQDTLGGPTDGIVYITMGRLAFEQLSNQVRMVFFAPGSTAFQQAAADASQQQQNAPTNPLGALEGLQGIEGLEDPEALRRALEQIQGLGQ